MVANVNMSSLKAICTHLDVISLSVFETLDEIYMCQANLETTLKNGHLLMAKSRYSMGAHAVGRLQYNETDMTAALLRVILSAERDDAAPTTFLCSSLDDGAGDAATPPSDVRRRVDVDDVTSGVEDLCVDGGDDGARQDPLRWFGVLVPQSLKASRQQFVAATRLCCQLATLRATLTRLRAEYAALSRRKQQLIDD